MTVKPRKAYLTAPLIDDGILREEIALETQSVADGIKRYRRNVGKTVARGDGASLKPAEQLERHWFGAFVTCIKDEQQACRDGLAGQGREIHGPILEWLDPEVFAVITMHEVLSACMKEPLGVNMAKMVYAIGRAVLAEINMKVMAKTDGELVRALGKRFQHPTPAQINWWAYKRVPEAQKSRKGAVHIGAFLIQTLMNVAICNDYNLDLGEDGVDLIPAFKHEVRREGKNKTVGYLTMTREAWAIIDQGHKRRQVMRPRYLPMIVPPYRWSKDADGGYVRIRTPFISKPTNAQKEAIAAAREAGTLDTVDEGLHAISCTPFRVNRLVLAVQKAIWESGGNTLGIPRLNPRELPPKPAGYNHAMAGQVGCWANVPTEAKKTYKREAHNTITNNIRDKASREEYSRTLMIADMFKERDEFFYPHQLDFRGRAYPIPPHLNHSMDDVRRGLLEFAEGKMVSDEDRDELHIEAANCWGHGIDKLAYRDRITWAKDHERQIAAVSKDPLSSDWWHEAEDPWQMLATIFALTDPTAAAHLPVGRDGSMNGLQHLAAMGRDPIGAAAVNLTAADAPNDAYSDVAEAVRKIVAYDAQTLDKVVKYRKRSMEGYEETEMNLRTIAAMVLPYVNRKTVKQVVMTLCYGVTRRGASGQILARLKEQGFSDEALWTASNYLSGVVLNGIGEVCAAAKEIMLWFRANAKEIAKEGNVVRWTSPIGMPVLQAYFKVDEVKTVLGSLEINREAAGSEVKRRVRISTQCSGFSPNFTHCVDKSHMILTAIASRNEHITFFANHDKYHTHAATRKQVDRITRQKFVQVHTPHLLDQLTAELRLLNPGVKIIDPPERGSFDINEVIRAPYCFS